MKIKDVMTRNVAVVHPSTTIEEAADLMKTHDVGLLPVCEGDRLVGMLTDRDITVRAVAVGQSPATTLVSDAMTPEVYFVFDDQDVEDAARVMKQQQVRRVVVLDSEKRLVGIASLGDLAVDTADAMLTGEVVERVSEPSEPRF
jgi:CBS domain-containing protein